MCTVLLVLLCVPATLAQQPLALEAQLYEHEFVERLPIVVKIVVRNQTREPVRTIFSEKNVDVLVRRSAFVVSVADKDYRFDYIGGPHPSETAPEPVYVLQPDEHIVVDRLFSPVIRTPVEQWSGGRDDLYFFAEPGSYKGHVEVAVVGGERLISNEVAFAILPSDGRDAGARARVALRHVDFFEGRDAPRDLDRYGGHAGYGRVDVSRFGEIQKILDDFPDSQYAQWIRFWKVYHHGSDHEALEYARTHKGFPLSDNVMFRVINRVAADDVRHEEALELLAELQRTFPNGDTLHQAKALQDKLLNKKRRP